MLYSLDGGIFPCHYQVPFDPFSDTLWPFVIAARNAIAKATGNRTADAHVLGKDIVTAAWQSYLWVIVGVSNMGYITYTAWDPKYTLT